jgi:hypothetical protein
MNDVVELELTGQPLFRAFPPALQQSCRTTHLLGLTSSGDEGSSVIPEVEGGSRGTDSSCESIWRADEQEADGAGAVGIITCD